jgi:hypothetical protein
MNENGKLLSVGSQIKNGGLSILLGVAEKVDTLTGFISQIKPFMT